MPGTAPTATSVTSAATSATIVAATGPMRRLRLSVPFAITVPLRSLSVPPPLAAAGGPITRGKL